MGNKRVESSVDQIPLVRPSKGLEAIRGNISTLDLGSDSGAVWGRFHRCQPTFDYLPGFPSQLHQDIADPMVSALPADGICASQIDAQMSLARSLATPRTVNADPTMSDVLMLTLFPAPNVMLGEDVLDGITYAQYSH